MPTRTRICAIAAGLLLSIGSAQADTHIKIGVLNDRSGVYADLAGAGSVVAVWCFWQAFRTEEGP